MIAPQNATALREQAARCARIAATLSADDAAVLTALARDSLTRADEMDGGAKANRQDVSALIDMGMAGKKPDVPSVKPLSATRAPVFVASRSSMRRRRAVD
jgi:hypothetical protein